MSDNRPMDLQRFERGAVVAQAEESARAAAIRMREHHVGCVVVTRDAHPIGILTDRDIALRVVAEGRDPEQTKIADIVTYDVTTIERDAEVGTAARLMREHGVRRLPIVDEAGHVTGIVTADDLVALLAENLYDVGMSIGSNVDASDSR